MKNSFFKTKEGGLTIAFIIIMIQGGLAAGMNALAYLGFILVIVSMLYSPVKVFIIDRKK